MIEKMPVTTVLLDAGGVILDESEHEAVRAEIIAEILADIVPGYTVDTYDSDVLEALSCYSPRIYQYVFWKHTKNDRALFDRLYDLHLERWRRLRPPIKLSAGIEKEIREISRHFKIGIAGQYGREVLQLLEKHSLLAHFAHHLTQDDFSITKPDPRYLEQLTQAMGVEPRECILVGDRIDNDIIPAKQLGMKTILVRVGLHKYQQPRIPFEIPDAQLDGITGLAAVVGRLAGPRPNVP
jgi:putative hydrolase of the HAD superfamily